MTTLHDLGGSWGWPLDMVTAPNSCVKCLYNTSAEEESSPEAGVEPPPPAGGGSEKTYEKHLMPVPMFGENRYLV